jgi:quinol monooxygenase YgiN
MKRLALLVCVLSFAAARLPVGAQVPPGDATFHAVAYVETASTASAAATRALTAYRDATLRLDGAQRVDVLEQIGRPGHWVVLESWRDQKAFDARDATPRARLTEALAPVRVSGYDERPYKAVSVAPARDAGSGAVAVVSHVDVAPNPAVAPMLARLAESSRQEPGNLRFDVLQHMMRANHFTVVETWRDQAALDAHVAAAHTRRYRDELQPLTGSPLDERVFKPVAGSPVRRAGAPPSPRLYVFDCGVIHTNNGDAYSLKKEEMASTEMSIPCILVAHPRGNLMWDNGYIPDRAFPPGGGQASLGVVTQDRPLLPQMAAAGFTPADVTHLSMSHYHGDHIANSNSFAAATWLVRKVERDRMFSEPPIPRADPANYNLLKNSRTVLLERDEHDVFGDGTVVIKSTPGHTPGHNVLFLRLKNTGPVVLSGDLYHYPEERTLNRLPVAEFNREQTAASRVELERFLKRTGAQLWIEHDIIANAKLKKAPAFYD